MTGQSKRLPAYGRDLLAAQRSGRNVPWLLIALDWSVGRALPRVVATQDIPTEALDLSLVHGLDCLVAHHGEQQRALDIAEAALLSGASICPVYDLNRGALMATAEILAARGLVVSA